MEVLLLLAGVPIGALAAIPAYWFGRRRRVDNIDYRDRWESAVQLLGAEGSLTDDQVATITGGGSPATSQPALDRGPQQSMESWDRRAVEVERAKKGLPPADDLQGMQSWDVKAVLQARVKYGSR